MTARFAKDDMSYVAPAQFSGATRPTGLAARASALLGWLVDLPRRRAVISELSALSDHELADIGLTRGELSRVFERQFAQGRARAH